jgi:hypothetical protein
MKLGKLIEEFAGKAGWNDNVETFQDEGVTRLAVRLNIKNQPYRMFIEGYEKFHWLNLRVSPPFNVVEGKSVDSCLLFNYINETFNYGGRISVDDNGMIIYKQIIDVEHIEPTLGLIQDMLRAAINLFETRAEDIAAVGLTRKTYEAIREELERKAEAKERREQEEG